MTIPEQPLADDDLYATWSADQLRAEVRRLLAIVQDPNGVVEVLQRRLDENEHERVLLVGERDKLRATIERYRRFATGKILDSVSERLGIDLRQELKDGEADGR